MKIMRQKSRLFGFFTVSVTNITQSKIILIFLFVPIQSAIIAISGELKGLPNGELCKNKINDKNVLNRR